MHVVASLLFSTQQKKIQRHKTLCMYLLMCLNSIKSCNMEEHPVLEDVLGGALMSMVNQYRS